MFIDGETFYPCTITLDRYGGTYSGAMWIAWPLYIEDVPKEAEGSDLVCAAFWGNQKGLVGKGQTPNEAHQNLLDGARNRLRGPANG